MEEYFVVAIEGRVYHFESYAKALEKCQELKALGYYEAVLCKHSSEYARPLTYNDGAKCFFAQQ